MDSSGIRHRGNNFNLLRFILASLVLLSHSAELIDGNRNREILTRIFGTISFGELAVNGFFILSGFLILQSWLRTPNTFEFLKKRILRIYPGFIAASLISAFMVGPLGSNAVKYFSQFDVKAFISRVVILHIPQIPPVFKGTVFPGVNTSMWTIEYEFRCYLLIAILGVCGIFRTKFLFIFFGIATLILSLIPEVTSQITFRGVNYLFANPVELTRFVAFFFSGACFYYYRDYIKYKVKWLLIAGVSLIICMFQIRVAQLGIAVFGAYLLFGFAFAQISFLKSFNSYPDISYGLYLYGWPTQKLLLWYFPLLSP